MRVTVFYFAVLFLAFSACPTRGEAGVFQLPFRISSRMSGKWGIEIHSPCEPYIAAGGFSVENATGGVIWPADAMAHSLKVESAHIESEIFDAVGLRSFMGNPSELASLSYVLCENQANDFSTPDRHKHEKRMDNTELTEYRGILVSPGADHSSACGSAVRDVTIRTIGSPVDARGGDDSRAAEALQFIEVHFDARRLTQRCAAPKRRSRRGSGARANEMNNKLDGVADQTAREGSIVVRFARLSLPPKTFFERYYSTLLFGGMMILYRAVYTFASYRSSKKK